MKKYFFAGLACCMLVLAGCSTGIKMTSSWNDTNNTQSAASVKKILVVGLFGEKSRDLRQHTEEQMAADLGKLGYTTFTSFRQYGPKMFVNISEDQAMHLIDSSYAGAYDGVIIVSIVDKKSTNSYVPGYYSPYPYYGFYRPFYSPFYTSYSPGYYKTDMHYSFEANFYDLNNKKMLYSGQSQVVDPGKPDAFAADYSRIIVKDMRKKNVLG